MAALLQELEHLKVVALDVEVLRRVSILAFLGAGAKCIGGGRLRQTQRPPLAVPRKVIAFL